MSSFEESEVVIAMMNDDERRIRAIDKSNYVLKEACEQIYQDVCNAIYRAMKMSRFDLNNNLTKPVNLGKIAGRVYPINQFDSRAHGGFMGVNLLNALSNRNTGKPNLYRFIRAGCVPVMDRIRAEFLFKEGLYVWLADSRHHVGMKVFLIRKAKSKTIRAFNYPLAVAKDEVKSESKLEKVEACKMEKKTEIVYDSEESGTESDTDSSEDAHTLINHELRWS